MRRQRLDLHATAQIESGAGSRPAVPGLRRDGHGVAGQARLKSGAEHTCSGKIQWPIDIVQRQIEIRQGQRPTAEIDTAQQQRHTLVRRQRQAQRQRQATVTARRQPSQRVAIIHREWRLAQEAQQIGITGLCAAVDPHFAMVQIRDADLGRPQPRGEDPPAVGIDAQAAENFMRSAKAPAMRAGVMMAKVIWKVIKTDSGIFAPSVPDIEFKPIPLSMKRAMLPK